MIYIFFVEDVLDKSGDRFLIPEFSDIGEALTLAYQSGAFVFEFPTLELLINFYKSIGIYHPEMEKKSDKFFFAGAGEGEWQIEQEKGENETSSSFAYKKLIDYVKKHDLAYIDSNKLSQEQVNYLIELTTEKNGLSATNEKLKSELYREINQPYFHLEDKKKKWWQFYRK